MNKSPEALKALEALMTAPVMSVEEKELRDWLKLNRETLKGREADEVADFAINFNGFDPLLVYRVISNFKDAMEGTRIEARAAMEVYRLTGAIEASLNVHEKEVIKVIQAHLFDLWKDTHNYQTGENI